MTQKMFSKDKSIDISGGTDFITPDVLSKTYERRCTEKQQRLTSQVANFQNIDKLRAMPV